MRNWTNEWLFCAGKIHRERNVDLANNPYPKRVDGGSYVDMICGVPVYLDKQGQPENGEVLMPSDKVPPAYLLSSKGRKYKVRYCKTCIRLSRSERTAA